MDDTSFDMMTSGPLSSDSLSNLSYLKKWYEKHGASIGKEMSI
jgi:hypothetical protein